MNGMPIPLTVINNAIREIYLALEGKLHRAASWTSMTEDALWRELVACILGSRVRFEVAHAAVERMAMRQLFSEYRTSSGYQQYEKDVMQALTNEGVQGKFSRHPFYRVRANQIRLAAERFYGGRNTLRSFLEHSGDIRDTRRRLILEVSGLGPKQASLFLRNIGYSENIAVLDIHVLTYMRWVGLIEAPLKAVMTLRNYEKLEEVFIEHAYSFGYIPDCFDLAVWVVVKVVKKEQKIWE